MKHYGNIWGKALSFIVLAAMLCGTAFAYLGSGPIAPPMYPNDPPRYSGGAYGGYYPDPYAQGNGAAGMNGSPNGGSFVAPNPSDRVVASNKNALLIADAGVPAPAAAPGETAEIFMPLVVNREYLPSDLYILRNITIQPDIPTVPKELAAWPFAIDSVSYVRHLDDMTYNSRADVTYEIPISETAKKGVYPIGFKIYATVWRYDVFNGTDIQEDVEFIVTVYVTVTEDGPQSGVTSELGALTVVATDEDGQKIPTPRGDHGDRIQFSLPLMNRGYAITDVTITPKVSANLNEFPFVSEAVNYGQTLPSMGPGETVMVDFDFQISPYATQGNKPVTFEVTYKENGAQKTCEVISYVYIVRGYKEPHTQSAPTVTVESYELMVGDAAVDQLYAGQDGVLTLTLRNHDKSTTARKVRIGVSVDTNVLAFSMGETDTKYVPAIKAGETAQVQYKISAVSEAAEGSTDLSITMNYENWEVTAAVASQTIPLLVKQPICVEVGRPTVYDSDMQPDEPIAMSLGIINKGRSKIYNVSIDVEGDGLEMYEEYYGGDVLSAAKLTADVLVAGTRAGELKGALLVSFEDSDGEVYTERAPFAVAIAAEPGPAAPVEEEGPREKTSASDHTAAAVGGGVAGTAAVAAVAWRAIVRRKKIEAP